jgi:hypothetical protein
MLHFYRSSQHYIPDDLALLPSCFNYNSALYYTGTKSSEASEERMTSFFRVEMIAKQGTTMKQTTTDFCLSLIVSGYLFGVFYAVDGSDIALRNIEFFLPVKCFSYTSGLHYTGTYPHWRYHPAPLYRY